MRQHWVEYEEPENLAEAGLALIEELTEKKNSVQLIESGLALIAAMGAVLEATLKGV